MPATTLQPAPGLARVGFDVHPDLCDSDGSSLAVQASGRLHVLVRVHHYEPWGASYADWLGVPQILGGVNLGRGTVAIGLTIAIIVWVGYLWASKVDIERGDASMGRSSFREQLTDSAT